MTQHLAQGSRATMALIGFAGAMSAAMVALVLNQHAVGTTAAMAATTMTAPVAYARRAPSVAAISLAAAAAANELFFGHVVRCAAALPAVFVVSFVAGYSLRDRAMTARISVTATIISVAFQCAFDPRLGAGALAIMLPLDLIFCGAGLYASTLASMVAALRNSANWLLEQREETVRLAVAAEREQLTDRLDHTLRQQLAVIAGVARTRDPERFAEIEQLGRHTLDQMRELLGSLRDSRSEPEPGLADLGDICSRATSADVRFEVIGASRVLPASIELAVCRIVEQLLRILRDEPAFRIRLHVDIAREGIDVLLAGPACADDVDLEHFRALAQARAIMHGGTVAIADRSGERHARVWLPLVTSHG